MAVKPSQTQGRVAYINARLMDPASGLDVKGALLTDGEMAALRRRTEALLKLEAIPKLDPYHNVPWPMV